MIQHFAAANVIDHLSDGDVRMMERAFLPNEQRSESVARQAIVKFAMEQYDKFVLALRACPVKRVIGEQESPSLSESAEQYLTGHGIVITAATDVGIDTGKSRNEDRIAINSRSNMAAVVDGIGGAEKGDEFADCLAHGLATFPDDMPTAMEYAKQAAIRRLCHAFAGACFASARIDMDGPFPTVTAYRRGDVRSALLSPSYDILSESSDESFVQGLLDMNAITKEQARLHPQRHVIMESIGDPDGTGRGNYKTPEPFWNKRPIERGSRILLMSDGITDNLETEELVDLIRGKTALEAIAIIDDVTSRRMTNKWEIIEQTPDRKASGVFIDGFVLRPKQDNRGIAIVEIPS